MYDVEDTEGPDLPPDVAAPFRAQGDITECQIQEMFYRLYRLRISCKAIAYGSGDAGHVRVTDGPSVPSKGGTKRSYEIRVNDSHDPNVQFATLAHELGHLFLGHLGQDADLDIKNRRGFALAQTELEAEMVSYLVCKRQGVLNVSEPYLAPFLRSTDTVKQLDVNAITRAAHRVEIACGLSAQLNIGVDRHGQQIASPDRWPVP